VRIYVPDFVLFPRLPAFYLPDVPDGTCSGKTFPEENIKILNESDTDYNEKYIFKPLTD
jgi:hypothetical protein